MMKASKDKNKEGEDYQFSRNNDYTPIRILSDQQFIS